MQNGQSSQHQSSQTGTTTPTASAAASAPVNGARARICDFNNPLVRRAYKATIGSSHIELQSTLLSAEGAGAFFAREVLDELLSIALNYKDKNAIILIAQAAIRESVQSSDALRFQEILFLLCDGRPETAEGRDNLARACTAEALHSADAAILAALLRYKIVPAWDFTDCGKFELICDAIARGGPMPDVVRPTVRGLIWVHEVCSKDTEDAPDRVKLIAQRFDRLLRVCEQRGGEPGRLAALYRGVGRSEQLAKMCIKQATRPAATPK